MGMPREREARRERRGIRQERWLVHLKI